jgi:gamma-glutamylcyclotransferase (GGCT)/AIG2-like uncharacterized protein YtfP
VLILIESKLYWTPKDGEMYGVFVYGTLRSKEYNYDKYIKGKYIRDIRSFTIKGFQRRRYMKYPMITYAPGKSVVGELYI